MASVEKGVWVPQDHLESLYTTITKQKGQLTLALDLLASFGFDLVDFAVTES